MPSDHEEPHACTHEDILDCVHFHPWFSRQCELWRGVPKRPWKELADELGVTPPLLSNILKQRRRLPPDKLTAVARVFGLDPVQETVMRRLYAWKVAARAPDADAAQMWRGTLQLQDAKSNPPGYLDHWSTAVIREMQALPDAPPLDDVEGYRARIRAELSDEQIANALSQLRSRQLRAHGLYAEAHRTPGADRDYHRQVCELAVHATSLPKSQRHLTVYTEAVSRETMRALQREIAIFMEKAVAICTAAADDTKEHVVQLSVQLFPVTAVPEDDALIG
jgi:uncharacterized protein (TIGR02147 family)